MDATPAPEAAPGASSSSAAAAAAEDLAGGVAALTLEERFATLRGIGEECIQEDELMRLLQNKPVPICYDGFEPSGRMHIAQVRAYVSVSSCDLSEVLIASRALCLR
jgi:tyrosyl-tRNA synthetase